MEKNVINVAVRHFPDKVKPCLVIEQGNKGVVVGSFVNEACAGAFMKAIGGAGIKRVAKETIEDLFN